MPPSHRVRRYILSVGMGVKVAFDSNRDDRMVPAHWKVGSLYATNRGKAIVKRPSGIAVGELSRQTQCHIETIRYYERIGLLPQPHRTQTRVRRYGSEDVARLRFIRRARQLGFTLDEVRALLRLVGADGDQICAEARTIATARVTDIRARIADLQAIEQVLSDAIYKCGHRPGCPIMDALAASGEMNEASAIP